VSEAEYTEAWEAVARDIIFLPGSGKYVRAASATNSDRLASVQSEFEGVHKEMQKEAIRAQKLEEKVRPLQLCIGVLC
jgi:hypothetical protein